MNTPEITFPRKKHSHRCRKCGHAVYCYKGHCTKPQRVDECQYCRPLANRAMIEAQRESTPRQYPEPTY